MQNPPNLLRVTLQSIRDAVVTTDQTARIRMFNRAAEALTGWSSAEAVGRPIEEVIALRKGDSDFPSPAYSVLRDNARVDLAEHLDLIGKGGRNTAVQVTASPLNNALDEVEGCVLILHDVSEAIHLADRMSYLAHHDPLTGLPNRILLMDRLEQGTRFADRKSDQLAVIFVDLDRFAELRNSFGNAAVEDLLKEVAYRMIAALRESDTVCRLGGGEFVIMVPGVRNIADVESVAAKLLVEIARPHPIGEQILQTTCSIGVSVYPGDATDAETLMRLADAALQQAKREGRDRYLFFRSPSRTENSSADHSEAPLPASTD